MGVGSGRGGSRPGVWDGKPAPATCGRARGRTGDSVPGAEAGARGQGLGGRAGDGLAGAEAAQVAAVGWADGGRRVRGNSWGTARG